MTILQFLQKDALHGRFPCLRRRNIVPETISRGESKIKIDRHDELVNELRMQLLTLVACFSVMLTGISYAKVATLQRAVPVAVRETAPDFTLQGQNGQKFSLSELRGKSPVVLIFYRGYW
jgi:hypothetical protein